MSRIVKISLVGVYVTVIAVVFGAQSWAVSLSFDPPESILPVGENIDIEIYISGLDNVDLSAFDLDIFYDDAILSFLSYDLGIHLGVIPDEAEDYSTGDSGGVIDLVEVSFLTPDQLLSQPDAFSLATLSFMGIGLGVSPLSFTPLSHAGQTPNAVSSIVLSDQNGGPISLTDVGTGTIDGVPEPGTAILLFAGMLGLAGFRRKAVV
jgi:hypothetical protein